MTRRIILFELRFWMRQPQLWLFSGMAFAFACALAVFEGGGEGSAGMVHVNSPSHVYDLYANLSFLWLPMVTAFVNATAIRDFAQRTSDIVFSTVVTKRQYVLGRSMGSTLVALTPTLGISAGLILGSWIPYGDPIRFGANDLLVHAQAFLWFAVTSIFFQSAVMFAVATVVRSAAAAFVTSIVLVVLNVIATAYSTEMENGLLAALLDPFANQALNEVTRYWSVDERNSALLPVFGPLTYNRLLWLLIGTGIFLVAYLRFSFTERRQNSPNTLRELPTHIGADTVIPGVILRHDRSSDRHRFIAVLASDLRSLFTTPVFWIITGLGLLMTAITLSEVTSAFGNHSWPVTYHVAEMLRGMSMLFIMVLITFYSGELLWRDRDAGLEGIMNALPVRTALPLLAKLSTLIIVGTFVLTLMALIGVVAQLIQGYTAIQPMTYFMGFILPGVVAFAFWSMVAMTIQTLVHNKYVGFGLFVVLFAVNTLVWRYLKVESNLVVFFGGPRLLFSDMNGFGPFLLPWTFFRAYWLAFAVCLLFIASLFVVRGGETNLGWRWRIAGIRWKRSWRTGALTFSAWVVLLLIGFYNTRILNRPVTEQDKEALQVAYEQTYQRYRNTALPHFTAVDITVELEPYARSIRYTAEMILTNKGEAPVDTLWFSLPDHMDMTFEVPNARLLLNDSTRFQRMYRLHRSLATGDSMRVVVTGQWAPKGLTNDVEFLSLVENGTFLNTMDLLPMIGYQDQVELSDPGERRKVGLPVRPRTAPLSDDPRYRATNETMDHADRIRFACTIGTAPDQTGIAPGTLKKEWMADGKRWFRYECEAPIFNFWAVLSARYHVTREQAGDVTLEVYHHPDHGTNVQRMLKAMRDALTYASAEFGPYPHSVARIIEFPRYRRFAQSFPGTMPYSEAIGFITDLRDTNRIDMVYYVVAHEVAHQWWGHQVLGPRMQGSSMLVESMAQYTALMVLEKEYGRAAMRKFLAYEQDNYLRGRGQEGTGELPLMRVEDQQYIHYNKGSVVMYGLRDMLGEERVNSAYRSFVDSFAFKGAPYPTTLDLFRMMEHVTPDSLRYVLEDGLKYITFYRNAISSASTARGLDGSWTVSMTIDCAKLHSAPSGKELEVPMKDWMDVAVVLEDGTERNQRMRLHTGSNAIRLVVSQRPKAVVIDPDHLFFDRVMQDNMKMVEVR
jgi:hypothetical protein